MKPESMFTAKQLRRASLGLFLLIMAGCLPVNSELPSTVSLKTAFKEDPYANDGLSFRVLCYHDTRDNLRDSFQTWPERGALETATMVEQFEWLRENGYHMVSLDDILAARNGGPKLPSKAILLTFDDGYLSMYTRVFPLLKLFNYPAVIGLVGEWLSETKDGNVFYGDRWISREHFVTWPQVREMVASGLVEVASHSHSLHKGVRSNPQGSLPSSAITRVYTPEAKHYETDDEYLTRLRTDLAKNSALIAQETGKKPRAMIWPYGAYNMLGVQAAEAEGMSITMTLEPGANTAGHPLTRMRRDMLFFNDKVSDLKRNLRLQHRYDGEDEPLIRIIGIDLDTLYDPDAKIQEKKLGELIERIRKLHINTVYVRAVADRDHDGYVDTAYFPNRHLPMRTDLFNRVAWQLNTRASVASQAIYIYAWLPVTAFETNAGKVASRQIVREIYDDAGKNAPRIAGVLLGDDKDSNVSNNRELTLALMAIFKQHHPYAFTARLISEEAALADQASILANLFNDYDFVTVGLSAPEKNNATTESGLKQLIDKVKQVPNGLKSAAFLLPTVFSGKAIPSQQLVGQLSQLQQSGFRNFGYYPDRFTHDQPALEVVKSVMSLETNPGRRL